MSGHSFDLKSLSLQKDESNNLLNYVANYKNQQVKVQYWGHSLSSEILQQEDESDQKVLEVENIHGQITHIIPGDQHLYIATDQYNFFAYGDNSSSQLGMNIKHMNSPVLFQLPNKKQIQKIFCGSNVTWAVTIEGKLYGWGVNFLGQLGLGHNKPAYVPEEVQQSKNKNRLFLDQSNQVKDISNNGLHTLLLTTKGEVYSCGFGQNYVLGNSSISNVNYFKRVQYFDQKHQIYKIIASVSHSVVWSNLGIFIWGQPSQHSKSIQNPTPFSFMAPIQDVHCGAYLTVVLLTNGDVETMGTNSYGQLGLKNPKSGIFQKVPLNFKVTFIRAGQHHVFAGNTEKLKAWGSNDQNQIQPYLDAKCIPEPFSITWLKVKDPKHLICKGYQTYYVCDEEIDFSQILTPEENQLEHLMTKIEKLKKTYIYEKRNNEDLNKKLDELKGQINVISNKDDTMSMMTTYEKMMMVFKKELLQDRTIKSNFEIQFNEIKNLQKISSDNQKEIYSAIWRGTQVYVKRLKPELLNDDLIKQFLSECATLQSLRHPNICLYYGHSLNDSLNLCLVTEYCSRGTLKNFLQNPQYNLKMSQIIKFTIDIAKAMHYLHSFKTPLVHRNLNTKNILLDDNLVLKISDFNSSRLVSKKMTSQIGDAQYMSPELLQNKDNYTEKTDVYSFGVILWEMISRKTPFEGMNQVQILMKVVNEKYRPEIPEIECSSKTVKDLYRKLIKSCWEQDPRRRVSFKEILSERIPIDQGKDEEFYLTWEDLTLSVDIKSYGLCGKKKGTKQILSKVSGYAKSGECLAIMGGSGAGKSTLLNIISGRFEPSVNMKYEGKVLLNGDEMKWDKYKKITGFVMQRDIFMEELSVREIFDFVKELTSFDSSEEKQKDVNRIVKNLKMERAQYNRVGGESSKGISGGEKRRLNLGFELLSKPKLLFLDEPTSGLDSYTSYIIIKYLKKIAQQNNLLIVYTIHQPSVDIGNLFDRLLILNKGKVQFFDERSKLEQFYSELDEEIPLNDPLQDDMNPLDHFIDVVLKDDKHNHKFYEKYENYETGKQHVDRMIQVGKSPDNKQISTNMKRPGFFKQFTVLSKRSFKSFTRNPRTFKIRLAQVVFTAIIYILLYWRQDPIAPDDRVSIQNRLGALFFTAVNLFILYFQTSLGTFPIEREIFAKEYQNGLYGIIPYYLSKLIIELPLTALFPIIFVSIIYYAVNFENEAANFFLFILVSILLSWIGTLMGILVGALVKNLTLAIEIAPLIFVPFLLYAGFTTNTENILKGLKFIEYSSPIRYAFEFFVINEFEDYEDSLNEVYPVETLNFSLGKTNIIIIMISYIALLIILGLVALKFSGTKLKN